MKKLLIAGDSYASETFKFRNQPSQNKEYSWSYLLEKKYQITNIAHAGTCLYWTYKQLTEQNFDNFDKVIVCVTTHGRLTLKTPNEKIGIFSLPNYSTVLSRLKTNPKFFLYELDWAKYYYENYYDEDIELIKYEAVLHKLINLVPKNKLILIPAFPPLFIDYYFNIPFSLKDITNKEIDWHSDFKKMHMLYSETDQHVNHMSMENKIIFANLIEELVEQGHTDITLDNFVPLDKENFDTYYKKN